MNNNFMHGSAQQENQSKLRQVCSFFSKGVFLVAGISSAVLTFLLILKTVVTSVKSQPDNLLESLYYFFGSKSVPFVNLVMGILASLFFAMLSFSFLRLNSHVKKTNTAPTQAVFKPMLISLAYLIILATVFTIIALGSISVLSYQAKINEFSEYHNTTVYNYYNPAEDLFFPYVLFSAAAIMISISVFRLLFSIKHTTNLESPSNAGVTTSLIALISGAVLCAFNFVMNLSSFLMPSSMINENQTLDAVVLITLMISTLISAAVVVLLIASAVIVSRYNDMVHRVFKVRSHDYISAYATNVTPQDMNRRPMPQPTEYRPAQRYGYQPYNPAPMPPQKFPQPMQNMPNQFISQPSNQRPMPPMTAQPQNTVAPVISDTESIKTDMDETSETNIISSEENANQSSEKE